MSASSDPRGGRSTITRARSLQHNCVYCSSEAWFLPSGLLNEHNKIKPAGSQISGKKENLHYCNSVALVGLAGVGFVIRFGNSGASQAINNIHLRIDPP